ncbi:MAG: DUF2877 domain-containing protein [Nocardioidaceae bacterium]|nr:DUF2877 domain-containing protein [Nocardioidaceae bacterium]
MPIPTVSPITVPGAGSAALRRRVRELTGTGHVLHAGAQAIYARFGDRVVGVAARGAVQVPATIATALPVLPAVAVGSPAELRDGTLYVAGLAVTVDRLVPTDLPRLTEPVTLPTHDLGQVRDQLPGSALLALAAGDPAAVRELLGRGDGLTPVGDDVVSGWLVTRLALGRPVEAVAAAVREHAHRTTTLSATLLADAIEGEAIPEFRALLLALAADRGTDEAVSRLLAIGHTSGAGMLLGAHLALSSNPERTPR